ncbi:MAG TPA: methyltransferase domain-containing protein [Acidimicrobiales bacterium]|nr:methyltransferase domain-containing protein [Acidimicrobiales bacterium]
MTESVVPGQAEDGWRSVDDGWGREAVEFATLSEPANCREYVAIHQRLGVGDGDRLLDVACGAGLAIELAGLRGASCAGIDASVRLVAVARDRSPDADLRVGDMHALPWADETFDVVTSFRGIWGTTPEVLAEVHRVLVPGGRFGLTVWGHIKVSLGAWALAPLALAAAPKVQNQAAMVALGRPGVGEALLEGGGFTDVERIDVPFVWEFADPETYARTLVSLGPAFEAIEEVGEASFVRAAVDLARERVREGLPLRAPIAVVGYIARKPATRPAVSRKSAAVVGAERSAAGFLAAPTSTPEQQRLYDDDEAGLGYVMNLSRLWAHLPAALDGLSDLLGQVVSAASITFRQRCVLVTAAASTLGDSYCSLAWGKKLADVASPEVALGVIRGDDEDLDAVEKALAKWARRVVGDPNAIGAEDVEALREAGFDDAQIFAITSFVALRVAFSTVNDALGVRPDHQLASSMPESVRSAVTFGRAVGTGDE